MPKIITLPRRRRRRRPDDPAAAAASAQPGVADNDDTPEGEPPSLRLPRVPIAEPKVPSLLQGNARAVEQAERAAQAAAARESGSRQVNAMEAMLAEDQAAA